MSGRTRFCPQWHVSFLFLFLFCFCFCFCFVFRNLILLLCSFHKVLTFWEKMTFSFSRTYHLWFLFIIHCCFYWQFTNHKSRLRKFSSIRKSTKKTYPVFSTWDFHNNSCLLGLWEIFNLGIHADPWGWSPRSFLLLWFC